MGKLAATTCETAKPDKGRDRLLGDGDGLFLRIRPHGTKTWVVEYEFKGARQKYTIGVYDRTGAPGESITAWLETGRLSLTQARSIAGKWKTDRRGGHDPVEKWESVLAAREAKKVAHAKAVAAEAAQPTISDAIDQFMAKHITGKKSAPSIRYRLDRLAEHIGDKKIRDVSRQQVIAAIEKIAEGSAEGRTAKLLAGEVLIQAKRLWRFAETREWVSNSCIEALLRKDFDAKPRKREVALRLDELVELWKVLGDSQGCKSDPATVAALRLLILTGQREREVTDAQWSEFDLDAGLWKIPASRTKKSRAHLVHLAPQAIEILDDLKKLTGNYAHAFASPLRKGHPSQARDWRNARLPVVRLADAPHAFAAFPRTLG